jgi:acyl carrier protein
MSDTFDKLKKIISEELRIDAEKIVPEANLFEDLNFDSLDTVETVITVEEAFDIEILDEDTDSFETVQDIVDYIKENS